VTDFGEVEVDEVITCVDCGGRCHLLTHPREEGGFRAGDVVVYRCSDCLDRWDVVVDDPTDV
jgi:DNA-directed RNA polymerase subunit RPC12/RpoP